MIHYLFVGSAAALRHFLYRNERFRELYSSVLGFNGKDTIVIKNSGYVDPVWIDSKINDGIELIESLFPGRPRVIVWEYRQMGQGDHDRMKDLLRYLDKQKSILVLYSRRPVVLDVPLHSRLVLTGKRTRHSFEFLEFQSWAARYSKPPRLYR